MTDNQAGRGRKQCPGCSDFLGVRTRVCPKCNHQFGEAQAVEVQPETPQYYEGPGRGRKQCASCKKYVGGRLSACYCGHVFHAEGETVVEAPEEIKTYDEAGRGRKQCVKCLKFVGARNEICACGNTFEKGVTVKVDRYAENLTLHPLAKAYLGDQRCRVVITPAGPCPVKLQGIEQEFIDRWVEELIDLGIRNKQLYSISAMRYYGREFFDIQSPQYRHFCATIEGVAIPLNFNPDPEDKPAEGLILDI